MSCFTLHHQKRDTDNFKSIKRIQKFKQSSPNLDSQNRKNSSRKFSQQNTNNQASAWSILVQTSSSSVIQTSAFLCSSNRMHFLNLFSRGTRNSFIFFLMVNMSPWLSPDIARNHLYWAPCSFTLKSIHFLLLFLFM
jgi:hypothetical protein